MKGLNKKQKEQLVDIVLDILEDKELIECKGFNKTVSTTWDAFEGKIEPDEGHGYTWGEGGIKCELKGWDIEVHHHKLIVRKGGTTHTCWYNG